MKYVEAPDPYHPHPDDGPSIFLAGGITGCPDWQRDACALLAAEPVVVLNPRRSRYAPGRRVTQQQVAWEFQQLQLADLVLFWFPDCDDRNTVQPIALLELGAVSTEAARGERLVVVGVADGYPRRHDVELQLGHRCPGLTVHRELPATVAAALASVDRAGA